MKNVIRNKSLLMDNYNENIIRSIKQYDDVVLTLLLYKDSLPFDLTNQTVSFGVLKPDDTEKEYSGIGYISVDSNQVTLNIDGDTMTDQVGLLQFELKIVDSNGEMTSPTFALDVKKKIISKDSTPIVDDTVKLFITSDGYQIISSDNYRILPKQV